MANLCTTLQALQQNILSDSDSETEQRRSRRYSGLLSLHDHHPRCRSSSSDGSRKSVDSVYIPRPRYRKQCIERGIASRPPLGKERRTTSESRSANRHPSEQSSLQKVSARDHCERSSIHSERTSINSEHSSIHSERTSVRSALSSVHSEQTSIRSAQSSDDRHSVDEVFKTLDNAQTRSEGSNTLDVPSSAGQKRKCGSGKRERSSEDSRRDSADDMRRSDTYRDRGTSDESRKSSFDEVFIPKTNGCGPHCLAGPEYIRCRCCGRFKKPETYQVSDRRSENDSPQPKQPVLQNGDGNHCSADSETNNIEDKPPPIPKRKPLRKSKPGTFQPTQIIVNTPCENKPAKHITFKEDTKENTNHNTNENIMLKFDSKQNLPAAAAEECMSTEYVPTVMTSRPASALGAARSRGPLPLLPSYEDIIGARGFGFRRTSGRSQWDRCNLNYNDKNSTPPEHPGLRWRSHSIDNIDRLRFVDRDPTNNAALSVSTDKLDMSSKKIIIEFLV